MNKTFHSGILRNVTEVTTPKGFKSVVLTLEVVDKRRVKGGGVNLVTMPVEFKCFGQSQDIARSIPQGAVIEVEGKVDSRVWKERVFCDLVVDDIRVLTTPVGAVVVPPTKPAAPPAPSESQNQDDTLPF